MSIRAWRLVESTGDFGKSLAVRRWMVTRFDQPCSVLFLRLLLVIDTLVSKLPNAIELYLSSVPLDDPVRFLSRSP